MSKLSSIVGKLPKLALRGAKKFWEFIWADKFPIIITASIAALLTYYISPLINEHFERQKLQAEYISGDLKDINSLVSDLYVSVEEINYQVANGNGKLDDLKGKAREKIVRLNWKLVETATLLEGEHDRTLLANFQRSVLDVNRSLDGPLTKESCEVLLGKMRAMSANGVRVIDAINRRAILSDRGTTH